MPPPPPSKPPPSPPLITPTSPKSLSTILTNDRNILHLLVYKTKNQHRSSLWFKWLQMLKRSLERITDHLQHTYPDKDKDKDKDKNKDTSSSLPSVSNANSDLESNSDSDSDSEESLTTLLKSDKTFVVLLQRLWIAIIPNAHRAFTTLITSTQYAAMGMVMLGCLARVHEVLKPFADEEITGTTSTDQDIDTTNDIEETTPSKLYTKENDEEEGGGEDTGEVISRDSFVIQNHQRTRKAQIDVTEEDEGIVIKRQKVELQTNRRSLTPLTADKSTSTKKVLEKKRTAIDDLFADF
ncbi:hypothetical protein AOL_s00215g556 [Orbilia oligospora ATCC 24927]|uniref:RNase MRP protein 1 RNA binding domain-containing protein n=1 Tax=Arthrobotrys oligospora (strain ATCC 24927 / CBS 115.81 / DSM 1491) TaxID=756982 RepID=G1XT58_ARTOA|nr:hypothetical protein AOL_s00215g556 [Orbilia oligospora ATCC 24927]EGX43820.1 hypothetical protein AOL_s00215g556 [Orbilia oligospora ATCC 24927]